MITTATIAAHIAMMRSHGQDEYADYARGWYWNLLGPYIGRIQGPAVGGGTPPEDGPLE